MASDFSVDRNTRNTRNTVKHDTSKACRKTPKKFRIDHQLAINISHSHVIHGAHQQSWLPQGLFHLGTSEAFCSKNFNSMLIPCCFASSSTSNLNTNYLNNLKQMRKLGSEHTGTRYKLGYSATVLPVEERLAPLPRSFSTEPPAKDDKN